MLLVVYPNVNDNKPYCLPGLKNAPEKAINNDGVLAVLKTSLCIGYDKCAKSGSCEWCGTGKCC